MYLYRLMGIPMPTNSYYYIISSNYLIDVFSTHQLPSGSIHITFIIPLDISWHTPYYLPYVHYIQYPFSCFILETWEEVISYDLLSNAVNLVNLYQSPFLGKKWRIFIFYLFAYFSREKMRMTTFRPISKVFCFKIWRNQLYIWVPLEKSS